MEGDSTGTEKVTWLSPAACDLGKQAADMACGRRSGGQGDAGVWDEAADPFTSTVKTTIRRLRAKLGDPPVIQTVRESGYRIGEP
jgi:hypothetical protein